jgi:hypothetical protein
MRNELALVYLWYSPLQNKQRVNLGLGEKVKRRIHSAFVLGNTSAYRDLRNGHYLHRENNTQVTSRDVEARHERPRSSLDVGQMVNLTSRGIHRPICTQPVRFRSICSGGWVDEAEHHSLTSRPNMSTVAVIR